MAFGDPVLGAQVLEIDPRRPRFAFSHRGDEAFRDVAPEGFDDDVAGGDFGKASRPLPDLDARQFLDRRRWVGRRTERPESVWIVDPQTDAQAVLSDELARQAPAHADVAEVVDDGAENVPLRGAGHGVGDGGHGGA